MEEFAEGGRLSPLKVKEFIPAGTLGIGVDENVWIRKSRTDGKTYWAEFLETWNYGKITPDYYNLNNGIRFKSNPRVEDKYGYEIFYDYVRGFKLVIFDADTLKDIETFNTENSQEFRDICIAVRDEKYEIVNASLRYEFTEIVGKLTLAFDKGELRKTFTTESTSNLEPKDNLETTTEFTCNVDVAKINSPYVGAFYFKNKDRIEKLKSEFSCKILESLVYLSDYENCGGGVQLPIQEAIEEDDLLGAIRNLK
jgi:hypothetical protein